MNEPGLHVCDNLKIIVPEPHRIQCSASAS